ncbi:unnamed protein product [Knipowitschia caucasica]
MLTYSVRNVLYRKCNQFKATNACFPVSMQAVRARCDTSTCESAAEVEAVLRLLTDRGYSRQTDQESRRLGVNWRHGPLGAELKRNLLEKWWDSVERSRVRVFGINSASCYLDREEIGLAANKIIQVQKLREILEQRELSRGQMMEQLNYLLETSPSLRTNFLQGALEQCVPSLELVNRKLPFGLAETGVCFPALSCGLPDAVTLTSLVWFCSPHTSSQWLDFWARQRLRWWKKFALSPSDFTSSDVPEQDLELPASRGVKIFYNFPWGSKPIETMWSRGDSELLQAHNLVRSKLQCRDGRKSIPHVVTVTANMDEGVIAFLFNSLQKREGSERNLHQRKVLKLHPVLAPVKVALDLGRGSTVELRQVCEGLQQELLDSKISTWPGYLEAMSTSMEQLNARYDEMGVLFSTILNESTLENGLLQVRSRDTTIKETVHISEIKNYLSRYASAAEQF